MSDITATILMFGFCIAKGENQGFLQKNSSLQLLQKGEVLLDLNKRTYFTKSPKFGVLFKENAKVECSGYFSM